MSSRSEDMLTAIVDGAAVDSEPLCRKEKYLKAIANNDPSDLPNPMCREEELLLQIAEKGIGGGDNPIITENITITPKESEQTIKRSAGKYINQVTVEAIPEEYVVPEGTIEITENGPYDVKNYESATINVLSEDPVLQEKTVIQNGEVVADSGYDGLSKVIVDVPVEEPILQEKTTTVNGEVVADNGYDGLSKVIVDVPNEEPDLTIKEITENGTYNASDDNADGFSSVTVNVPEKEPVLQEKTATSNGDVTPDEGYDGLSKVVVNVAGSGGVNVIEKTISHNGIYNAIDDNVDGYSSVKISILSSEATPITVPPPEVFQTATRFYYFQINNDRILLSANVTGIGVWSYSVSTNIWKQLRTEGENYSAFQLFDDKCFIGSDYAVPMLVYSYANDEIIAIAEPNSRNTFNNVDGLWYCGSNSPNASNAGLDVYDPLQNTITPLLSTGYAWNIDREFHNGRLIYSLKSNGLYLFEPETNTCTELANTKGVNFKCYLNDNLAVLTGTSSTHTKGLFIYNVANKTVTRFLTSTYNYGEINFQQVSETQWLILGQSGIALYDAVANEVTQLTTDTSKYWANAISIDKLTFITSSSTGTNYLGIYLYDAETQTITKITDIGYGALTIHNFDAKYVITYTQIPSTSYGMLLYDHSTKSTTTLLETGGYYYSVKLGDTCIFTSTTSATAGVWLFDSNTNEITKIYETTYTNVFTLFPSNNDCLFKEAQQTTSEWQLYNGTTKTVQGLGVTATLKYALDMEDGNYVLTGGSSDGGIYFYDSSSKTLTKVITSNSYYAYDTSHKIENGYLLIPGGGMSTLYFYNLADKTITEIGLITAVGMSVVYDDGETCIFTSNSSSGGSLDLFDIATKTITKRAYVCGYKYSVVEENELGALLSDGTFFVQYNKNDKSCKLVGYHFG